MVIVYAISSINRNYIYVGMTKEFNIRFKRHNNGKNRTTKAYAPFKLIYKKELESQTIAREHEIYLKSGIGREFLKSISAA